MSRFVARLSFLFLLSFASAQAQTALEYGNKPAGFDGTQQPTEVAAKLLQALDVRYPEADFKAGRQGVCIIAAWVDDKGYVTYARVASSAGHASLDSAALNAVLQGDFKPAQRAGKTVASRVSIPVEFRVRRDTEDYDAPKSEEALRQEAEELRRARRMLEQEQRALEEELRRMKEQRKEAPRDSLR